MSETARIHIGYSAALLGFGAWLWSSSWWFEQIGWLLFMSSVFVAPSRPKMNRELSKSDYVAVGLLFLLLGYLIFCAATGFTLGVLAPIERLYRAHPSIKVAITLLTFSVLLCAYAKELRRARSQARFDPDS